LHHQNVDSSVELNIQGMTCAGCVRSVEKTLSRVPGVTDASVDLAAGRATVRYDDSRTGVEDLTAAVGRIGFEASRKSLQTDPQADPPDK
jgi:P-type Cu+ transporter